MLSKTTPSDVVKFNLPTTDYYVGDMSLKDSMDMDRHRRHHRCSDDDEDEDDGDDASSTSSQEDEDMMYEDDRVHHLNLPGNGHTLIFYK